MNHCQALIQDVTDSCSSRIARGRVKKACDWRTTEATPAGLPKCRVKQAAVLTYPDGEAVDQQVTEGRHTKRMDGKAARIKRSEASCRGTPSRPSRITEVGPPDHHNEQGDGEISAIHLILFGHSDHVVQSLGRHGPAEVPNKLKIKLNSKYLSFVRWVSVLPRKACRSPVTICITADHEEAACPGGALPILNEILFRNGTWNMERVPRSRDGSGRRSPSGYCSRPPRGSRTENDLGICLMPIG